MGNKTLISVIVLLSILLGAAVPFGLWLYMESKALNKATYLIIQENKRLKAEKKGSEAHGPDPERTRDTD